MIQKSDEGTRMVMLNIGCGSIRPEGWINTDSSLNAHLQRIPVLGKKLSKAFNPVEYKSDNVVYMNCNKRWQFDSSSVDVVYASHLFEHLSLTAADLFLSEAHRTLKPGGAIRLVVPDLYQISKKYVSDYEATEVLTNTTEFIMWAINMHRVEPKYGRFGVLKKLMREVQGYPHQHKYMYDKNSLRLKLAEHSFGELKLQSYGMSDYIPRITDVEGTRESYLSVYVEAKKPLL